MDDTLSTPSLAEDAAEAAKNITTLTDYQKVRGSLVTDSAESRFNDEMLPFEPDPAPREIPDDVASPQSATESDGSSESLEAKSSDQVEKEPKARRPRTGKTKNAKDRIDKIVWEREEARKEAADLRGQLQALRAPRTQEAPVSAPVTGPSSVPESAERAESDAEPVEAGYSEYGDFVAAKARWAARQEVSNALEGQRQQQAVFMQQEHNNNRASAFAEKMAKGSAHDPEFLAKVPSEILNLRPAMSLNRGEEPTGATAIADVLLESETPQILMAYLSSHEDDFRRISALHPMLAMREIGRIEVGLDAVSNGSAFTPVSSQAQPPIRPVGSSSVRAGVAHRAPKDINSLAEWRVARSQLLHQR
jgi:hypothetical protein